MVLIVIFDIYYADNNVLFNNYLFFDDKLEVEKGFKNIEGIKMLVDANFFYVHLDVRKRIGNICKQDHIFFKVVIVIVENILKHHILLRNVRVPGKGFNSDIYKTYNQEKKKL